MADLDRAALDWVNRSAAGPFLVRRNIPLHDVEYRGRPARFDHSSAYAQWGSMMVELVEDHTEGPSVVSDVLGDRRVGLHHLAFFVDDVDDTVSALGAPVALSARTSGGTRFVFLDTVSRLGHMIELYQRSERLSTFYGHVAAVAQNWQGEDPLREL